MLRAENRNPHRNAAIDLLRGLSIVLVVLHHLGLRVPLIHTAAAVLPRWLLLALNWNGYESVFVFFVISGFLIAGNALRRWPALGEPDIRAFYSRRAARIVPGLLVLVAVLSACDLAGLRGYTINTAQLSLPRAVIAAVGLHLNWYEGQHGYLPGGWDVLWSLSIEELFYLLFPLTCLLARRHALLLVIPLGVLALSLPASRGAWSGNEIMQEKAYLPGMAAIATGVLAALMVHWRPPGRRLRNTMLGTGVAAYAAILFAENLIWPVLGNGTMLVLTLGAAALLIGLDRPANWRLPGTAWLQAFGRLSYEVYLTHMFVVFGLLTLWRVAGGAQEWNLLLYPAALGCSLALAWLVARALTLPAERRLRLTLLGRRDGDRAGR